MTQAGRPWRFVLAATAGTSHRATGAPCQDCAVCECLDTADGSVLVAVVCDGAGSAVCADIGAGLTARTVVGAVCRHVGEGGTVRDIDRDRVGAWLDEIVGALTREASAQGRSLRDYACTLLIAVVGETCAAFAQIGDGAIVISRGDEEDWSYMFWPQHGEFANTTNFVVSHDAARLLEFAQVPERLAEVALFSDGLENLVLHQATRTVFEPFFRRMLAPVRAADEPGLSGPLSEALVGFLDSPRVCERTDDDKSLVLASRHLPA